MQISPATTSVVIAALANHRAVVCSERRVVACERVPPYYANLRKQDIERRGTDDPCSGNPIPFDLRLARLNANLRQTSRMVDVFA